MNDNDESDFDVRLLRLVRRAFDDGPSADALERARHAGRHAHRQRGLARVERDSLTAETMLRHSGERDRSLSLAGEGLTLDLDVVENEAMVIGRLEPAGPAEVTVTHFDGERRTAADAGGRFVAPLDGGPFRVTVEIGETRMETPWISR
jgi:hypothetical protein